MPRNLHSQNKEKEATLPLAPSKEHGRCATKRSFIKCRTRRKRQNLRAATLHSVPPRRDSATAARAPRMSHTVLRTLRLLRIPIRKSFCTTSSRKCRNDYLRPHSPELHFHTTGLRYWDNPTPTMSKAIACALSSAVMYGHGHENPPRQPCNDRDPWFISCLSLLVGPAQS